ncbi:MAG TPA: MlaD family protein [Burkholderiales bacterium]|nr:MlaD family protein [Burkholderiales bacterium]
MENRAYAILTGLFTVIFGAAAVAAFVWFRGDTKQYEEYELVSRYSVNGLYPQAEVRFRGIVVGKVASLQIDPQDTRNILVRILVERQVPITRGAYGQIGYQGVTGLAYVMLDDDGSNPARVARQGGAPGRVPMRSNVLDDLASTGQNLLKQASDLLQRLNSMASEENGQRLSQALANFESASAQLEPALRAIPQLTERAQRFFDEENARRLKNSLANLEQATGAIAPVAEDSRRVLASMRALSENLDRATAEISSEITETTLPKINTLVDQLTRDSRDLRQVLLQVEREPQSLLFGRPATAPGPGEPGFSGRK